MRTSPATSDGATIRSATISLTGERGSTLMTRMSEDSATAAITSGAPATSRTRAGAVAVTRLTSEGDCFTGTPL